MASAGVVGQQHPGPHRLDPEPQILILKLRGAKKRVNLPRRSSWERMVLRESSVDPAEEEAKPRPESPPVAAAAAAAGGAMPAEGCAEPAGPPATSPGSADADGRPAEAGSVGLNGDCGRDGDFGHHACERPWRSAGSVLPIGRKAAHQQRDSAQGRRDTWGGESRRPSILCPCSRSSVGAQDASSLPPLQRLTQGRTGVVKLARTDPPRREAWSIFPGGADPRVMAERGEGHRFEAKPVKQDWCDACNRQITAQALKCHNCSYTCHLECERKVQLDCNQRDKDPGQTPAPRNHCASTEPQRKPSEAKEDEDKRTKELSEEEVQTRIQQYNSQVSEIGMKLASDGTYTGFIKVNLRLSRPVTVSDVEVPEGPIILSKGPSESHEKTDGDRTDKRTSFYLPSDCVKHLHISSVNTTQDVIQGLLKKFMVLDNPSKFALYKQMRRDGQDLSQKLPLHERPLLLRLIAGPDLEQLSFVLKDNETEEVAWHQFSIPELQNFLTFLEKEEADRVRTLEQRYSTYRQKLQQALQQHDLDPATCHPLRPGRLGITVEIHSQTTEGAELVSHTLHPDMQMTHTLSQAQDPTDSPPPSSKRP